MAEVVSRMRLRRVAALFGVTVALASAAGGLAAQGTGVAMTSAGRGDVVAETDGRPQRPLKCAHPADPRQRHFECKTASFDPVRETLTGDWNQARDAMKRLGITPTASYQAAWLGAASGPGTAPTFAGQFNASLNVELDKAIGAWTGFSFYVSGIVASQTNGESWLNTSLFAVDSLAAGNTGWLGEMYLQQTTLGGALAVDLREKGV